MKPGFAVDIDNVLAAAEEEVQRIYHELTGKVWPRELYASAGGLDRSDMDRELIKEIFDYFHDQSIPFLSVMPGARLALSMIQQQFRIIIITARRPSARPQTLDWLRDHSLPFDELHLTDEKTGVANNLVFAVDDHPGHAQDYVKQGIKVFLMDQPWNQRFSAGGVTRVINWKQLLKSFHQKF
jgi:5'(3')-deoxyribonucleotidase